MATLLIAFNAVSPPRANADFDEVSASSGIGLSEFTYGLSWNDFDGDGHTDLLTCRHFARPAIYRGIGGGDFDSTISPPPFEPGDHHGPVVADFDNDGDPDIYLTGGAEGGTGNLAKHFYRNDGAFHFVNVTRASGLADSSGRGRSCSAMDVNADGKVDLFVAKARRLGSPNSLYLNDGTGLFTDIAASAGIADEFGSVGGVWGDYDRDGDADLFVSGEEHQLSESRLYRNNGNLTFTNVTAAMLPGIPQVAAAAWGDFDNDADLDLVVGLGDEALFDGYEWTSGLLTFFVNARDDENGVDGIDIASSGSSATFDLYSSGYYDSSSIYIGATAAHPGAATPFTVTGSQAAGQPPFTVGESVGLFIWREGSIWKVRCCAPAGLGYNYGGVINPSGSIVSVAASDFEPYTHGARGTRLYRNDTSVFTDVSTAFDINDEKNVRNLTWVDYDRDGDLDVHVLAKGDTQSQNETDLLYRNRGTYFTDETSEQDMQGPSKGLADACAWEDCDGDGDLDVAILSGSPPRAYALLERDRLYRNDASPKSVLRVNLEGRISSRDGLGAWVTCVSGSAGTQSQYVTGNAWRGGQVMTDPYFGLRSDTTVDVLRVEWPSGSVSELTDVPVGEVTVIEEGDVVFAPEAGSGAPVPFRLFVLRTPSTGTASFGVTGARGLPGALEIFDVAGRRVHEVRFETTPPRIDWQGKDSGGRHVANGVYYAALREVDRQARTKVVMLRSR
jgi:hypothetical protein